MEVLKELPKMDMTDNETGCCPRFHGEDWNEKTFQLDDLLFAKASTKSFMYMPINMGKVMTASMNAIRKAHAEVTDRYLILSQDKTKWHADHYYEVTKNVPGMDMSKVSGVYLTKVYSGPYKELPKFIEDFKAYMLKEGHQLNMDNFYAFYTTCPKCAKHYGKNDMVFFGKI